MFEVIDVVVGRYGIVDLAKEGSTRRTDPGDKNEMTGNLGQFPSLSRLLVQ
jgi:hypothetical protein